MRPMLIIATAAACLSVPAQARDIARTIVADIDMSEWTPPLKLTIDLASGQYSIEPPAVRWPPSRPKPGFRRGTITGENLDRVRKAFDGAFASGMADAKCAAVDGQGYEIIISTAGVPHMALTNNGKQLLTASQYTCWTSAAHALHSEIEQIFDRKTPT